MINSYEIKKYNDEEIIFLYFDLDSEFAKINFKNKYSNIETHIKKFIKDNRITFNGTIAIIVVGGTILGNVLLNNDSKIDNNTLLALESEYEEIISSDFSKENNAENILGNVIDKIIIDEEISDNKEEISKNDGSDVVQINKVVTKENKSADINNDSHNNIQANSNNPETSSENNIDDNYDTKEEDNNTYITIQRANGQILNIELEEYITGVVASEMPALFHQEALKAQAVIARTYALKAISKGKILSDSNSTQNYKDISELKNLWGENFNNYYNKIKMLYQVPKENI